MPDLHSLVDLFYSSPEELGEFTQVAAEQLPEDARRLLAHNHHMTVTVEAFHGSLVDVRVLEYQHQQPYYSRKILLTRQSDGAVVQFGIVRLDLRVLSEEVAGEILSRTKPLGRVLIEHNVLRQVQLDALWRIVPNTDLQNLFSLSGPTACYGRTALIYCNGEPGIELLEVVTP